MKLHKNIVAGLILILVAGSHYLSAQEHNPYISSKAFEQLKRLLGSLEGRCHSAIMKLDNVLIG